MQFLEEFVVAGAVLLGVALVFKGDTSSATGVFLAMLGYVFGRVQKVNGAMVESLRKK